MSVVLMDDLCQADGMVHGACSKIEKILFSTIIAPFRSISEERERLLRSPIQTT